MCYLHTYNAIKKSKDKGGKSSSHELKYSILPELQALISRTGIQQKGQRTQDLSTEYGPPDLLGHADETITAP